MYYLNTGNPATVILEKGTEPMRSELTALRNKMKEKGIQVYLIPTTDWHGSEYVNDFFKCREYISGFTGSAGTLAVEADSARLWTDGRYFIQAEKQLAGSGITLMKMGEPGVPELEEYLAGLPKETVIGFDGRVISWRLGEKLQEQFRVLYDVDLAGDVWPDRPRLTPSKIYPLPLSVTGESEKSKLARVRAEMGDADYLLVSRLEDVAWLYNLRGSDIDYTPVFYSFALISQSEDRLYVMDQTYRAAQDSVKAYEDIVSDLEQLHDCSVILDQDSASYSISKSFNKSVQKRFLKSPIEALKAVKNETEIAATRRAHEKDGIAMAEFLCWLKKNIGIEKISECSASDRLEAFRKKHGAYDLSFSTIAGYEEHGAIVHYSATEESDAALQKKGFLLIDSGGQYEDGTTDITRTVALGPLDADRKKHYTAVLKSHIALARTGFTKDASGADLDRIARKPLKDLGLDFKHGTGHGVGHMLSVHEGPNTISPRGKDCHILPGMITSNEPGVYLEGKYGIRIENELLCIKQGGNYAFESLTLCPYEREAMDLSMLTEDEIQYIDQYHHQVYQTLKPLAEPETREWLARQCRPLRQEKAVLEATQSICPKCRRPVDAFYIEENEKVYFIKECPEHGVFKTTAAENAKDYKKWVKSPVVNIAPRKALTAGDPKDSSCPLHCGTCENHMQTACCVLIDLTDRCNQHCPYCFARSEMDREPGGEPTLAEIEKKFDLLLNLGEERPFNIQLSGGEPTVREDLPEIIGMARDKGFNYVQINSNGRRLALEEGYARILKEAGASVIFMQFDGTRDEIYEILRGEPLFEIKKKAIQNCEKAGLAVTLVPTIVEGVNSDNIGEMMDFLVENVNVVKGIHFQPVSFFGRHPEKADNGSLSCDPSGEAAPAGARTYTGDFPGRMTMFGLLRELEKQRPDFKFEDYCPISTGHTLCCFYSTYIREPDGSVRCTLTHAQKQAGVSCCGTGAAFAEEDKQEIIRKDRDFVLNKWEILPPEERERENRDRMKYKSSEEITSLDEFLRYYKQNTFTVTGMAFQDITNMDARRVKRCRVQVLSEDNRLIPFCAYNSIYRDENNQE